MTAPSLARLVTLIVFAYLSYLLSPRGVFAVRSLDMRVPKCGSPTRARDELKPVIASQTASNLVRLTGMKLIKDSASHIFLGNSATSSMISDDRHTRNAGTNGVPSLDGGSGSCESSTECSPKCICLESQAGFRAFNIHFWASRLN